MRQDTSGRQVFAFTGQAANDVEDVFLVIYYPDLCGSQDPLGDVDVTFATANTTFSGSYFDPATGTQLGTPVLFQSGAGFPNSVPAGAGSDLVLIVRQL